MGVAHVLAARGQVSPVLAQAAGGALPWWNPDGATPGGVGGSCIGAYQAKGATSYAASLVNLANPGTNDLLQGNGAVPWDILTGWSFVSAAAQYFYNIGLIPDIDQSQSLLIQFTDKTVNGYLTGVRTSGRHFSVAIGQANNGGSVTITSIANGNIAIAGNQGYINGVANGSLIPNTWVAASHTPFVGTFNNSGVPYASYPTFICCMLAYYNTTLTALQVLARATAMAAI